MSKKTGCFLILIFCALFWIGMFLGTLEFLEVINNG